MSVKVYNDNKYTFTQEFKGDQIIILPGESIDMDYDDAVQFKSMFYPPQYDGSGNQKPESYKMLRIEGHAQHVHESFHVCAACGDKFGTESELSNHVDKNHLEEMTDQKEADKRRKAQTK